MRIARIRIPNKPDEIAERMIHAKMLSLGVAAIAAKNKTILLTQVSITLDKYLHLADHVRVLAI